MELDYDLSSSSTTIMTKVKVILNTPEDWHDWKAMIKQRALALGIWEQMDPDTTTQPAETTKPAKPTLAVGDATFSNTMIQYNSDLKEHTTYRYKANQMLEFIIGSINKLYLTFINDQETLWSKMTALKKQLEPYKKTREVHLLTKLSRLKKTPSRL